MGQSWQCAMRAGCSQLPARLGVGGFGVGFWFLAVPDEVACLCPKFAKLRRPLLMSAEDELQRRAAFLRRAPDEKWAFVIRMSARAAAGSAVFAIRNAKSARVSLFRCVVSCRF